MRKILYFFLKPYFEALRADVDYCLMIAGEKQEENMHSPKFELVKGYYDRGLWSEQRVRTAVGKWITQEECNEILGVNA